MASKVSDVSTAAGHTVSTATRSAARPRRSTGAAEASGARGKGLPPPATAAGHSQAPGSYGIGSLSGAPAVDPIERQQLIRCEVTRIEHVVERFRHIRNLCPAEPVSKAFDSADHAATHVWTAGGGAHCQPTTKDGKHLPRIIQKPQANDAKRAACHTVLRSVLDAQRFMASKNAPTAAHEYPALVTVLLEKLKRHVTLLSEFLDQSKTPSSKLDAAQRNLLTLVQHFRDDFDELFTTRLPAYCTEAICELHHQSMSLAKADTTVSPSSEQVNPTSQRAPQMMSMFVLDIVVGHLPAHSLRPLWLNTNSTIATALERVRAELKILDALSKESMQSLPSAEGGLAQKEQRDTCATILRTLELLLGKLTAIGAEFAAIAAQLRRRAIAGEDQSMLIETKEIEERRAIAAVLEVNNTARTVAKPFLSPQYCRRRGETYASPCHIRVGFRFFDPSSRSWRTVESAAPTSYVTNGIVVQVHPQLLAAEDQFWIPFDRFPELVRSSRCVIDLDDSKAAMADIVEEPRELGGYFVVNGGERILRTILMQRCNVPINMDRERFASIGQGFSSKAVVIRCKRRSGLTAMNYFYYVENGDICFTFARKVAWQVPLGLLIQCCGAISPTALMSTLIAGRETDTQHVARCEAFVQHFSEQSYGSLDGGIVRYLSVLGRKYRQYFIERAASRFIPELSVSTQAHCDAWYGLYIVRRHVLPHLNALDSTPDAPINDDSEAMRDWPGQAIRNELGRKFDVIIEIIRQLHDFVAGVKDAQGNDVPSFQEVFMPSHALMGSMEISLNRFSKTVLKRLSSSISPSLMRKLCEAKPDDASSLLQLHKFLAEAVKGMSDPLSHVHKIISTGNFATDGDEDFFTPQNSGWAVQAERLNFFRFVEQLRTLHRGKRIADMRSAEVRKYPNEAFGFMCMAHSPDGEDCGVVNFMSEGVFLTTCSDAQFAERSEAVQQSILAAGIDLSIPGFVPASQRIGQIPLWIDGVIVAYVTDSVARRLADTIRSVKLHDAHCQAIHGVSAVGSIEVVHVPLTASTPAGLFVFLGANRMMRHVLDVKAGRRLAVGSWEQVWLDIAGVPSELVDAHRDLKCTFSYIEEPPSSTVSLTSLTIPFFEHNCSPRNLFQCGLSKQSAGTQMLSLAWRTDPKLFRMLGPQRYLVRTLPMDDYNLDDFSLGVNATVAVLSYTGFDMDDAVIINHTAVERGLFRTVITVSKVVDLREKSNDEETVVFHNLSGGAAYHPALQPNGLPHKRSNTPRWYRDHSQPMLTDDTAVYCTARRTRVRDPVTDQETYEYTRHLVQPWKHFDKGEPAWIHNVVPLTFDGPDCTSAVFVFRIPRNPIVGDKFSSRHGQKGTLPLHIRNVDLPFTSSGFAPDVIINPHAFPSRMTVGMLLEIMAGKLGALQGRYFDNTPWSVVDEDPRVADSVGTALLKCGYSRHGRERMFCGITGQVMEADVFVGISGYQRLRHMVSDKWQARARTDMDHRAVSKTGQPVKGRKRHGGVRVGEMERDGLLSHGVADVVLDRLMHVSDKTKAFICRSCGGMIAVFERHTSRNHSVKGCRFCDISSQASDAWSGSGAATDNVALIDIPQVLRLWCAELASIGVRVAFSVRQNP